jgi:carboxypeptidase Taq
MSQVLKLLEEFNSVEKEISLLKGISALLDWDRNVNLPKKAYEQRADQEALISVKVFDLLTSKKTINLVKSLSQKNIYNKLSYIDMKRVDLYNWKLKKILNVPKKHVEEYVRLLSVANHTWEEARNNESYKEFAPSLKKIFDMKKQEAKYIDAKAHPYDLFLDDYERGITMQEIDKLFSDLKPQLITLINKIKSSPNYNKINSLSLEKLCTFPKEEQLFISNDIAKRILVDTDRFMFALTTHPFMTSISPDDLRITSAVRDDPFFSFGSTSHEAGHALYESNFDPKLRNTILTGDALGLGMHESQSRFWENMVCKSESFWKGYYPLYVSKFPMLKKVPLNTFYQSINITQSSPVRIEADELTYCLHIIIRYELEKGLLEGKIKVENLEQEWNNKYKDYLGIIPPSPSKGVIQDVHWSSGLIGYFPTYALGSIYSAMVFNSMKKAHPQLEQDIEKLDFTFMREWLKENIHKYAGSKTTKEVISAACGKDLNVNDFVDYLKVKYYKIYGIKE